MRERHRAEEKVLLPLSRLHPGFDFRKTTIRGPGEAIVIVNVRLGEFFLLQELRECKLTK